MQIRGNVFACFGKSWGVLTCLGLFPVILFLGSVQRMAVGADDSADKPQADSKSAADDGQAASEKKNERPLEIREKLAKRPYNFITMSYMSVPEGGEEAYLKIEREWREIHLDRCRLGDMKFWGVMKVERARKADYQFVTYQGFDSLDDAHAGVRWWKIQRMREQPIDVESLIERTIAAREMLYTETYQIVGYEGLPDPSVDESRFGYFQPVKGRDSDYEKAELEFAAPVWKKIVEADPSFKMWGLTRLVSTTAESRSHKYRIFHLIDSTQLPTTPEEKQERDQLWKSLFAEAPGKVEWGKIRTPVNNSQLTWVMKTPLEENPVEKEWELLTGSWKHVNEDGSYRIKRISKHQETLEIYSVTGELERKFEVPMRIEVRNGINHFYAYHGNVTYHSVYKVHDGKFYEQGRGIFRDSKGMPNRFVVYDRIDE